MKFTFSIFLILSCLSCSEGDLAEFQQPVRSASTGAADSVIWKDPTEVFTGNVQGKSIIFMQKNYQLFRLSEAGRISTGNLNTERGYGDDPDATVYILDHDKPDRLQKYFVRLSSGSVRMLDSKRQAVNGELKSGVN